MHISKITNFVITNTFKGYRQEINNIGETVYRFNFPHDNESKADIKFFKPEKMPNGSINYIPLTENIPLEENGTIVKFSDLNIPQNTALAYKIYVDGKHVTDSGLRNSDGINIIPSMTTTPLIQGAGILTMPDSHLPGARYEGFDSPLTGKIIFDLQQQRMAEMIIPNQANRIGGTLAGLEYDVENLKTTTFSTPIWGSDNKSSGHYWTKNMMQISDDMGNIDNFETFTRKLFANGKRYIDDFAITSEGIEGIHAQYAQRWANQKPQFYYWFRMSSTNDNVFEIGNVPENSENLRYIIINSPVKYNPSTGKIEKNPEYDSDKGVYIQTYDKTMLSEEEAAKLKEPLAYYKNNIDSNELSHNSYMDTIIPYSIKIKPSEYQKRLESLIEYNKTADKPIDINSPEGAMFICQFSNFKLGKYTNGINTWDGKNTLLKYNYHISGSDEKILQAIPDLTQRDFERKMIERGNCEVQDMVMQAGRFRAETVKDSQILYSAQIIKNAKTEEEISKLIGNGLPKSAKLSKESIDNILKGSYLLAPKNTMSKEDVTIKALMKLPLDSLEFSDDVSGILSTSYFSNRATDEKSIGATRFELYKQGAELVQPYSSTYKRIDNLFESGLKVFADEVIKRINENSAEKLLDLNGNYTEYGEYVIDIFGKEITKYALLKAVAGNKLQAKYMAPSVLDGKITYNYPNLRKITSLETLGINASTPQEEAKALADIIIKGVNKLNSEDVDFVTKSILRRIKGTNVNSFRLAEAIVNKVGLGYSVRLDAAKDVIDMDAVRNGDMSFDEAWDQLIAFWKNYVQIIKEINPHSYIVAEVTDVNKLMEDIYGRNNVYDDVTKAGGKYKNYDEALQAFFKETGITSEAGYAYTFTDLLKLFSAEFENGTMEKDVEKRIAGFKSRIETLIKTRGLDYIRNLWTFADNHDKPSIIHCAALDMRLFYANLDIDLNNMDFSKNREYRIKALQELTNSDSFENLPIEALMNIDNRDYFRTVSTRAVAMSNLMRTCINETISNEEIKKVLKSALVDLTNGSYLDGNIGFALTIDIEELSSLANILKSILKRAGIELSDEDFNKVLDSAKKLDKIEKYAIQGDFNWGGKVGQRNKNIAQSILGNKSNYMKYDLFTVGVSALLMDSYKEVMGDNADTEKFKTGCVSFVTQYDRETINKNRKKLPYIESNRISMKKNSYAAQDFETVINMIIKQAEYKSKTSFTQSQKDDIMVKLFRSSTEPAVQKALMYGSFLSGLPGIPSLYMRDMFGGLGYEELANNVYLKNRSAVKRSQLTEGPLKEYRQEIYKRMDEALSVKENEEIEAIAKGTPYILEPSNKNIISTLYQNSDGNMVISVMNATGVNPEHRAEYDHSLDENADSINNNNKYVPVQPKLDFEEIILPIGIAITVGTIFKNISSKDDNEYIIQKIDGKYKLVNKSGKPITLSGKTAKNGTMLLKRVVNKTIH